MNRWKLCVGIAIVLSVFSGVAFSKPAANTDFAKIKAFFAKSKSQRNQVELLFLQQADSGSIMRDNDKPGCYTLTLSNLHQNILYFSDQPKRKAGHLTVKQFIETWMHNRIKPNVAMQAFAVSRDDIKEINAIVVLTNPNYNARNQSITYTACAVPPSKMTTYSELRSVNLFIDQMHQWPP